MQYDPSQIAVIEAYHGDHLVLAPPGCGKTHILTERIRVALEQGVDATDMLCLTFTNRAARNMRERVYSSLLNDDNANLGDIFIGNVHRYCSRFLFENAIIPAETSVIDDDDVISIMARFTGEDEGYVQANFQRRKQYFAAMQLSAMVRQIELQHPRELRIHPDCLSVEDISAMKTICKHLSKEFTREMMLDIYHDIDNYFTILHTGDFDSLEHRIIQDMLRKMRLAWQYYDYKRENQLVDFEDLLITTYDTLANDTACQYKCYPWVQIDEVQDLNPLQMAIVEKLSDTTNENFVAVYLGDEQQAIFSFMGAKMSTLQALRNKCHDNVHSLAVNHRSPDYMLKAFNTYAEQVLGIDTALLPSTTYSPQRIGNEMVIISSNTMDVEYCDVAQQAQRLYLQHPDDTTAVIVTSNADADIISNRMQNMQLPHFKISGTDMFSLPETKLLVAHLSVLGNENNFMAWARLLKGLRVYEQNAAARNFVRQMKDCAICLSDFLVYDNSTYVQEFVSAYESRDIVVFDTETTGLDVYEDDILQIAAVKIRKGRVVPGSEFVVYIKTEREIPAKLGDIDNPIIEQMKNVSLLRHDEALRMFVEYVGDGILLGHNADFDYNILKHNILHYLPSADFDALFPSYFDSLKLARLLLPNLHQYKLKYLLEVLHLEGQNSHLADDDVNATKNVVVHCYGLAKDIAEHQRELLANKSVKDRIAALRRNYRDFFNKARRTLWTPSQKKDAPSLVVAEMHRFMEYMQQLDPSFNIPNIDCAFSYINSDLVNVDQEKSLKTQIDKHCMEISTLREADICGSGAVKERVFVSTIHKAKGLEFDNVIIFDAVEGRYPSFYNRNNPQMVAEDARKFYVAMTRARKRLAIAVAAIRHDYHNQPHPQNLTRFMQPLLNLFTEKSSETN